ncbi:MAG: hypothetical protein ACI9K5_000042 [Gammaproteobacteria bacterium]
MELAYGAVPPDGGGRIVKTSLERVGPDQKGSGGFHFGDALPGVGHVRCAVGPVTLTSFAEGYGVVTHELVVEHDGQRFELEVDSYPVLELEFLVEGKPVPLPPDARIHLHRPSGERFFRWSGQDGPRHRLGIEKSVPLTVTFEDFFGYEPPPEIRIESLAGEDLHRQVELIPAK